MVYVRVLYVAKLVARADSTCIACLAAQSSSVLHLLMPSNPHRDPKTHGLRSQFSRPHLCLSKTLDTGQLFVEEQITITITVNHNHRSPKLGFPCLLHQKMVFSFLENYKRTFKPVSGKRRYKNLNLNTWLRDAGYWRKEKDQR